MEDEKKDLFGLLGDEEENSEFKEAGDDFFAKKDSGVSDEKVESSEEAVSGESKEVEETSGKGVSEKKGKKKRKARKARTPKTNQVRKSLSHKEKMIRIMLRRANLDRLPELDQLMKGKVGTLTSVKSIAIFTNEPTEDALKGIFEECKLTNTVNLSAPVLKNRMIMIGAQILSAGRMYQPIQVAKVGGELQCTSGRHRLAFLAVAYGPDVEIPVYIEEMTLNEARDAVVVANQARSAKAMERAEYAVLQAVGGNVEVERDELYSRTATNKAKARKYAVYCVFEQDYPDKFDFDVSYTSSRKEGGFTTITNVERFWGTALDWKKDTERKDFDGQLAATIKFLNELVKCMQEETGFNSLHHLSAMCLTAIGKYYLTYGAIQSGNAIDVVEKIAKQIVAMGDIGRQKSEKTYDALAKVMREL